nr:site-specific DNA-methyltransferase [candidate division KSB1 bacterium]
MKPYYDKDGITIWNGNCLEVMKQLEDKSFNLVVTSPPYNIGKKYDELDSDSKSNKDYFSFTKEYLEGIYDLMKNDARFCLNIGYKVSTVKDGGIDYVDLLNEIKRIRYKIRETIIWVKSRKKENPQSFCGANTSWGSWMSASNPICRARMEFIFILNKKDYKRHNKGITTITKQEFMDYASNVWYF